MASRNFIFGTILALALTGTSSVSRSAGECEAAFSLRGSIYTSERAAELNRWLDRSEITEPVLRQIGEFVRSGRFRENPELTMKLILWSLKNDRATLPSSVTITAAPAIPTQPPGIPNSVVSPNMSGNSVPASKPSLWARIRGWFRRTAAPQVPVSSPEPTITAPPMSPGGPSGVVSFGLFSDLISNPEVLSAARSANLEGLNVNPIYASLLRSHGQDFRVKIMGLYSGQSVPKMKTFSEVVPVLALVRNTYEESGEFVVDVANQFQSAYQASPLSKNPIYSQIPAYNVFKMIKESVRFHLNEESETFQDIQLVKDPPVYSARIRVIVFSNRPVDQGEISAFGFSVKELKSVDAAAATDISEVFSWTIDGKVSRARVSYRRLPDGLIRPAQEAAPRYSEMLADGKLGGMIMIVRNMAHVGSDGIAFSQYLGDLYWDYFNSRGFEVESMGIKDRDETYRFIADRIQDGEIDYAIREGHSEFSPESMVSMSPRVEIYKATKAMARASRGESRAYEEVVYLMVSLPETGSASSVGPSAARANMTIPELGGALRARSNPNGQFVYFDSACFAHGKIAARLEYAAAPGFTPVGSGNMLETFTETRGVAAFEFLNGIRYLSPYSEMKRRIRSTERVIFPNEGADYLSSTLLQSLRPMHLQIDRQFSSP